MLSNFAIFSKEKDIQKWIFSFICFFAPPLSVISISALTPLLILGSISLVFFNRKDIKETLTHIPIVFTLLILYCLITPLWSLDISISLKNSFRIVSLALAGMLWPFLLKNNSLSKSALYLGILLAFGIMVFDLTTEYTVKIFLSFINHRYAMSETFYNQSASFLSFIFWILIPRKLSVKSILLFTSAAFMFVYIVDGDTPRYSFIFGLITYISVLLLPRFTLFSMKILIVLGVIGSPFFTHYILTPGLLETEHERIEQVVSESASTIHRIHIWNFCSDKILKRPIQGYGINSIKSDLIYNDSNTTTNDDDLDTVRHTYMNGYGYAYHPHNSPLQWWLDLGIIGTLLVIANILYLLKQIRNAPKEYMPCLAASFSSCFFVLMVGYNFWQSWVISSIFLTIGLSKAFLNGIENESTSRL